MLPNPNKEAVVICGSVGEVANDFRLGSTNGYDVKGETQKAFNNDIYLQSHFGGLKRTIWANTALYSEDQLRQRMAWALYQIIPIGKPLVIYPHTETWLQYYDIFVRHAFGSFRDVLREVSYTDLMSEWLSFERNKSIQYNLDDEGEEKYPDENYAREIMQLFSIGLYKLNMDGSYQHDEEGRPETTYDNDDIMSMARAWTGFTREYRYRGNAESWGKWGPHVDPLQINRECE